MSAMSSGPDRTEDIALIERNVVMQTRSGIDPRRVDAGEMRRLVPGISVRDGSVGAFEPGGGGVDPVATVEAFAALAREKGAITLVGTAATGFLRRDGRVVGVTTDREPIEAERVVVAAGPWARRLLLRPGGAHPPPPGRAQPHLLPTPP